VSYHFDAHDIFSRCAPQRHALVMTAAILYGASSGALHAVTGPDHILSLCPQAIRARRGAFGIGLSWGVGHGVGTLLLAIPLLALSRSVEAARFAALGDRIAGAVLVLSGLYALWSVQRTRTHGGTELRSPLSAGFVHGVTGAGSLTLILPAVVSADAGRSTLFMVAFAVGSTLAMGALTALIGRAGAQLEARRVRQFQCVFALGAVMLGAAWLL